MEAIIVAISLHAKKITTGYNSKSGYLENK